MSKNSYHFITRWLMDASPEEVYRTLEDVESLPRWWPSVYLDVKVLEPGDDMGVGKVADLYTKGWLPYTLRWKFRVTEAEFPIGYSLEAWGDFVGRGMWSFSRKEGSSPCEVTFDWEINAEKGLLKYLSFLFKPIFSANHHWAMKKGEESLKLELLRRNSKSEEERYIIPDPPRPTFPHNFMNNKKL